MEDLIALITQLKQAGVTPQISIDISPGSLDAAQVKALQTQLQGAGVSAQVRISIQYQPGGASPPGPEPPVDTGPSFLVTVKDQKLNCFSFDKRDGAGKPIMEIVEPRIQLFQGARFSVSATHTVSDKDKGDGTVVATGGVPFYFITDAPSKPEAAGLYVRQSEVRKI